jgi:two-component system chemotaxis response regulator CheB
MTIKVLIADDSKVVTQLLCNILGTQTDIEVVACAEDGDQAVELTKRLKPDLITMDVLMPKMDGIEATRVIMEQCPTPIIIISSLANDDHANVTFNALEAGALSLIEKPCALTDDGFTRIQRQILNEVRTLANVHVIRRQGKKPLKRTVILKGKKTSYELIALASSTGGPVALNSILSTLPKDFPIPIVITQHIIKGFLQGLINWLQHSTQLTLHIAQHQQKLYPGNVYFAPDNRHLLIRKNGGPVAILCESKPVNFIKPSATVLFSSIAASYPFAAIGGLLTGMGRDGAEGLLNMRKAGCITFAQSEQTSVVYGMPGAAVLLNAVDHQIDLEKIPQFIATLTGKGEER